LFISGSMILQIIACYFLNRPLKIVPPQLRLTTTGKVWLLMIPFFVVLWNFFVLPKISKSLKNFADSQGNYTVGDCGKTLGLLYAILMIGVVIPYLGILFAIPALIILIFYLVKINVIGYQLKKNFQIPIASPAPQQPDGETF
jgi:hypothetical protein